LPKPLAANHPAKSKTIPDSDDPPAHYYRGFLFDDDALISAFINISLGLLAKPAFSQTKTADQACPSNRQGHLLDQNDLYAHDA
jgi:hypothetical protein